MTAEELQALYQANPLAVWGATAAVAVLLGVLVLRPFSSTPAAGPPPFLDPTAFKPMVLAEKRFVTHNTLHLKFALESPDQRLGLPVGQHMSFVTQGPDGKDVYRSYTPVSDDDLRGAVEFVIKVYPEGKMSQALNRLQVGEAIRVKGPKVGASWGLGGGGALAARMGVRVRARPRTHAQACLQPAHPHWDTHAANAQLCSHDGSPPAPTTRPRTCARPHTHAHTRIPRACRGGWSTSPTW